MNKERKPGVKNVLCGVVYNMQNIVLQRRSR